MQVQNGYKFSNRFTFTKFISLVDFSKIGLSFFSFWVIFPCMFHAYYISEGREAKKNKLKEDRNPTLSLGYFG